MPGTHGRSIAAAVLKHGLSAGVRDKFTEIGAAGWFSALGCVVQ